MSATRRSTFGAVVLAAILASVAGPRPVRAQAGSGDDLLGRAVRANEHTLAMEYDQARAELAKADPDKVQVVLAKARLAIYEEDCDLAAALLSRGEAAQTEEGRGLADIARGCARVCVCARGRVGAGAGAGMSPACAGRCAATRRAAAGMHCAGHCPGLPERR